MDTLKFQRKETFTEQFERIAYNKLPDAVVEEIIDNLITKAKSGNFQAGKLLFDRIYGPITNAAVDDRLYELEGLVEQLLKKNRRIA